MYLSRYGHYVRICDIDHQNSMTEVNLLDISTLDINSQFMIHVKRS